MKERPILFSAPMVRALLAGMKTQTRRVAKLTEAAHVKEPGGNRRWHPADPDARLACPYGQPGDLLWVRETWGQFIGIVELAYRADYTACSTSHQVFASSNRGWRASIHMPRAASRITLRVTDVRVERLQDISDADIEAEGLPIGAWYRVPGGPQKWYNTYWDSHNADRAPWSSNPWVWVVSFEREVL